MTAISLRVDYTSVAPPLPVAPAIASAMALRISGSWKTVRKASVSVSAEAGGSTVVEGGRRAPPGRRHGQSGALTAPAPFEPLVREAPAAL